MIRRRPPPQHARRRRADAAVGSFDPLPPASPDTTAVDGAAHDATPVDDEAVDDAAAVGVSLTPNPGLPQASEHAGTNSAPTASLHATSVDAATTATPGRPQAPDDARTELLALVTFCNAVAAPESLFALVDLSSGELRELPFSYDITDHGATGMAYLPDGSLAVALPGSHRLIRLSPDLQPIGSYADLAFDDLHSVAVRDDSLLVTSTGRDCVLELAIVPGGFEPLRSYPLTGETRDTLHVNSVCIHDGRVLASTFGDNWRDQPVGAPIGCIVDLTDGRVVSSALRHPHTLVSTGERLYVLESFSGMVDEVRPDGRRGICALYPGYLRGLSFFDGGALVGVSGRRRRSRGLGTINVAGPEVDQRCGIVRFSPDWEVEEFLDLSWYGREIFDVVCCRAPVPSPSPLDSLAAAKHRSVQLEATWEAPPEGPHPPTPD